MVITTFGQTYEIATPGELSVLCAFAASLQGRGRFHEFRTASGGGESAAVFAMTRSADTREDARRPEILAFQRSR